MSEKIKLLEKMLYDYRRNKIEIKNLKLDLEILENDYTGVGNIGYDERSSKTYKFNSSVENEIVRREKEMMDIKREIRLKEIQIQRIDDTIEVLSERENYIIKEFYFNNNQIKYISMDLSLAETYCSTLKTEALKKLIKYNILLKS
ncbi:RNA polymerase subunit sigma [Clostridium sp.]|uniref:RNA polymerase subunit sigma n=1 Tax=Clostridium sp. TaxID=1506 RepID=UPI00290B3C66|nr:RNA polymerase subunit sigma [Clostridium sp.]MDU3524260.1 RNA polymerase subunit sigma [Clostridium sp.]MDU3546289.1 RNA polymerase subunit sigma [Clostridium sp.]MDU6363298.1 RNA polymerase subunit sigma [Clostridium sp.]